ncbi:MULTISPECIES: DUF465 domain-containing protein [unclassified Pseudomonas]|uniref:DUF465 domain-containing protein n=1 Tax=unclassified Pseudomonas TaxID=196821 RepID=UPI000A1FCF70|nr:MULTISPECIES: DUF465 domain-containing protein [unclassified Pseudomonas]
MPVKHDLLEDLKITKDAFQKLRTQRPHLDSLANQYQDMDDVVVKAENATSDAPSDDALKKLKEKRLQIKDKIVQELQRQA